MGLFGAFTVVVGYITCLTIPYYIFQVVHRQFVHPLRTYPGPWLARITDSYAGYYALRRCLHLATWEDHKRYGNVMRYGPDRLIFNSVTALHDIYQNPNVTKSDLYLFSTNDGIQFIFNSLDRDAHLRKRKIIGPALSERSMKLFEPVLTKQVDIFLRQLLATHTDPVNVTDRFRRLGMDVVGHLAFGFPLDLQINDEHYCVLTGFSFANFRINSLMNFPFLGKLGLDYLARYAPMRKRLRTVIQKMITTRLQNKDKSADFFSFITENLGGEGDDFQHSELFSEGIFFISAGGDTVSTLMSALFFYLSRYQDQYRTLCNEIRTSFKSADEIRGGSQLAKCRYLRACIDETLRLSPPIGGTLWRQQIRQEGSQGHEPFAVDGHVIPPGTHVGVNIYSIHHNAEYFPDPFSFKPERWLSTDSQQNPSGHQTPLATLKGFTPFSIGARSCAGKPMAYMESSLVIAKTLWYFDFEKCGGDIGRIGSGQEGKWGGRGRTGEFQLYDVLTSRHDGPYLTFTPRGDHHRELQ